MIEALLAVFILATAGLVAWRWFLAAHVADKANQRAHELELKKHHVAIDQGAIDLALGKVRHLEERVKTLEYRPRT